MKSAHRDHYKVLQVDPEAEPEIIQAAYETLAARFHPLNDLTGVHEVRLKELNRAYDVLSDPGRRRVYDIERSEAYRPMGPGELIGVPVPEPEAEPTPAAAGGRRGLSARLNAGPPRNGGTTQAGPSGSSVLNFGRFAGMSLRDIAGEDTEYLRWLARHSSGIRYRSEIENLLRSLGEQL
jgi:curved DNA-binding protein CbpA